MKAYNSVNLFNHFLRKKVEYWYGKNLLSEKQCSEILNSYQGYFYTPNIFVKIGLFLFTSSIILAVSGICILFSLPFLIDNINMTSFSIFTCILFAFVSFVALEIIIDSDKVFNAGTDEALVYFGFSFLGVAIYLISDSFMKDSPLFFVITALPFLGFGVLRYADRIATLLLCFCGYAIVFLVIMKLGDVAKIIMPFALMLFSGLLYFKVKQLKNKTELFYWKNCISVAEYIALMILYASCNYYVIRESSVSFFKMQLMDGQDISFAFLFYVLTAIVPLIYMVFGLKRKDKTLLWSGLISIAISALTFKYYFNLDHPEISLTVAGIILIIVAYLSINYFKIPKYGITFAEEKDENSSLTSNAEALIVLQGMTQENSSQESVPFGGGQSGGAGSGGTY